MHRREFHVSCHDRGHDALRDLFMSLAIVEQDDRAGRTCQRAIGIELDDLEVAAIVNRELVPIVDAASQTSLVNVRGGGIERVGVARTEVYLTSPDSRCSKSDIGIVQSHHDRRGDCIGRLGDRVRHRKVAVIDRVVAVHFKGVNVARIVSDNESLAIDDVDAAVFRNNQGQRLWNLDQVARLILKIDLISVGIGQ